MSVSMFPEKQRQERELGSSYSQHQECDKGHKEESKAAMGHLQGK